MQDKLTDLDKREERLIDLAEAGLPQHKIRERINKLREERARLTHDLDQSGAALAARAAVLENCIRLAADVRDLYVAADSARADLNDAIFRRLFVDDDGVKGAELREPFNEIVEAARVHQATPSVLTSVLTKSAPARGGRETTHVRGTIGTLSHLVAHPWG